MGILGLHDADKIGQEKFQVSHAGGYFETEDIELVAAADVDEEKLVRFGDAWEIPDESRYVGHESMLATEDLDIVSVCSPTFLHHDHVIDAVESDAAPDAVWCEKPIASSVTDALEMQSVCDTNNAELVINHSFRFVDKVQILRDLLSDGLIGEVKSVTAQFRRELLRNSTHLLDTLVFLLDSRAANVYGYINGKNDAVSELEGDRDVDDSGGGGMVVLDDGAMVMVDCTVKRDISAMNIQLIGTEGKLSLNNDDGEWRYWTLEDGNHIETPIPGITEGWNWDTDYESAFPNAAEHLVDILNGTTDNLSPGDSATRSLEMIIGFYISHYTGGRVSIPLDRPLQDITITSW